MKSVFRYFSIWKQFTNERKQKLKEFEMKRCLMLRDKYFIIWWNSLVSKQQMKERNYIALKHWYLRTHVKIFRKWKQLTFERNYKNMLNGFSESIIMGIIDDIADRECLKSIEFVDDIKDLEIENDIKMEALPISENDLLLDEIGSVLDELLNAKRVFLDQYKKYMEIQNEKVPNQMLFCELRKYVEAKPKRKKQVLFVIGKINQLLINELTLHT